MIYSYLRKLCNALKFVTVNDREMYSQSTPSCSFNISYVTAPWSFLTKDELVIHVEIKCQLDATEVFIADLTACSTCFGHHYAHHQELKSIIQWLLREVFCPVVFSSSWSGVELRVIRPVCRMLVSNVLFNIL